MGLELDSRLIMEVNNKCKDKKKRKEKYGSRTVGAKQIEWNRYQDGYKKKNQTEKKKYKKSQS